MEWHTEKRLGVCISLASASPAHAYNLRAMDGDCESGSLFLCIFSFLSHFPILSILIPFFSKLSHYSNINVYFGLYTINLFTIKIFNYYFI